MLAIERKNEIMNKLRLEQRVLVSELAVHYGVTEETIRRDLDKLEKEGYATKTYGGAIWGSSLKADLSHTIRNKTNVDAKSAIAAQICAMIHDGDHLMLDESSTSLFIAKQLKDKKNLTIITSSVEIVVELSGTEGFTILCTGGQLRSTALALDGFHVPEFLSKYHVDKAIISCKGIHSEAGITDSSEQIAMAKKAMIKSAHQTILAVDDSKFDKAAFRQVAAFEDIQMVVTNCKPPESWQKFFLDHDIPCRYPEE